MANAGAAEGMLRCMFEAVISGSDFEIRKRPYHKNCGCALHNAREFAKPCFAGSKISYPCRDFRNARLVKSDIDKTSRVPLLFSSSSSPSLVGGDGSMLTYKERRQRRFI